MSSWQRILSSICSSPSSHSRVSFTSSAVLSTSVRLIFPAFFKNCAPFLIILRHFFYHFASFLDFLRIFQLMFFRIPRFTSSISRLRVRPVRLRRLRGSAVNPTATPRSVSRTSWRRPSSPISCRSSLYAIVTILYTIWFYTCTGTICRSTLRSMYKRWTLVVYPWWSEVCWTLTVARISSRTWSWWSGDNSTLTSWSRR